MSIARRCRPLGAICRPRSRFTLAAIAFVALALAVAPAPVRAAGTEFKRSTNDLTITADSRWPGCAHGGYCPIRIKVSNTARARDLEFVFFDSGTNGSRGPRVSKRITIEQNATQQFSLSIPVVSHGAFGEFRVLENGRVLDGFSHHVTLADEQVDNLDRPALLVVSPTPRAIDCADFEMAVQSLCGSSAGTTTAWSYRGYSSLRTNDFLVIEPGQLPESWIDYSGIDIVAVPLAIFDKLPSACRGAILQWVQTGGTLVIFDVGEPAAASRDLARLLDVANRPPSGRIWHMAQPANHKPITVVSEDGTTVTTAGAAGGAMVKMQAGNGDQAVIVRANNSVWPVSEETFSRLDMMAGRVYAFPGNPFPGAAVDWAWWLNSVGLPNLKFTQRNGFSARQRHPEFYKFLIPGVGDVPVIAFVFLISLFALAIGPVNYFVVARRRQLYLLVVTIPAIAFITSCALFGYALVADGFGVQSRLRSVTLLDQHSRTAVSFNRISLYAGLTPSNGLKFSPETAVFPIWKDEGGFESGSVDWTNQQHLASGWLRSRTRTQFATIASRALRSRLEVGPPTDDGSSLEVSNGLEWDLEMLLVKDDSGRSYFGRRLPAGAKMQLAPAKTAELDELAQVFVDNKTEAPPGAEDSAQLSRRSRMSYYIYNAVNQVGFSQSQLERFLDQATHPVRPTTPELEIPARRYVAILKGNPDIELGVEHSRESAGLHVVIGYY